MTHSIQIYIGVYMQDRSTTKRLYLINQSAFDSGANYDKIALKAIKATHREGDSRLARPVQLSVSSLKTKPTWAVKMLDITAIPESQGNLNLAKLIDEQGEVVEV